MPHKKSLKKLQSHEGKKKSPYLIVFDAVLEFIIRNSS
jgi:hypothetical protein